MAVQYKYTAHRGDGTHAEKVTIGAGSAIAGSDAIEVNVDVTKATRADIVTMLELVKRKVLEGRFPPL